MRIFRNKNIDQTSTNDKAFLLFFKERILKKKGKLALLIFIIPLIYESENLQKSNENQDNPTEPGQIKATQGHSFSQKHTAVYRQ